MIKRSLLCLYMWAGITPLALGQQSQRIINFPFENVELNGVLNLPEQTPVKGLVLIVHGSGRTDAVAGNWYFDVRKAILTAGYGTYMWDKQGCGGSGGEFDYNQSIQNSAEEVFAAIHMLQQKNIPGAYSIGLWGISRAGWINPLVINQNEDVQFWISVSGVTAEENFGYLLSQNLKINGYPQDSIALLVDEWKAGTKISHSGKSYRAYLEATKNLNTNSFLRRFSNGAVTEEAYYRYQKQFMTESLDEKTSLQIYIPDFDSKLAAIKCPVLALFGEKDMHVDWRKTKRLYEQTLAPNGNLTVLSFPDCNHNMFACETGGFFEMEDDELPFDRCDGFLAAITNWLVNLPF